MRSRREKSSDASWYRYVKRFEILRGKAERKRALYMKKYSELYAKYYVKEVRFLERTKQALVGLRSYIWVKRSLRGRPNNPYERQRVYDYGFFGTIKDWQWAKYWPPTGTYYTGFREFISSKDDYSGYLGPTFNSYGSYDPTALRFAARDAAVASCYNKINKQSVHIGNMVAERAKSFSMIADIAKQLSGILTLKRKAGVGFLHRDDLSSTMRQTSSDFLAFQYGVKPLLSDAYGIGSSLARLTETDATDKIVVRSSITRKDESVTKGTTSNGSQVIRRVHCKVTVSYVLEYKLKNGALANLQSLGLVNPAEIAWEVLPWSFVVDWFIPVSNYIHSFSADFGLEFVTGTRVETLTTRYTTEIFGKCPESIVGAARDYEVVASGSKQTESKIRIVLTEPPVPYLPSFKSPFSTTHVLNSIALLLQQKFAGSHFR